MGDAGATATEIEAVYRERFRAFVLSTTALLGDGEAALDAVHDGFVSWRGSSTASWQTRLPTARVGPTSSRESRRSAGRRACAEAASARCRNCCAAGPGSLVEIASGELASGDEWALIAWRSENNGLCVDFAIPGNSPFACGLPVRGATARDAGGGSPAHAVAGAGLAGGDGKTTIFGVAANDVAAVEAELADGRLVDSPLYDAPAELEVGVRFFIVRVRLAPDLGRADPVRAYTAYDRDGRLIERVSDD